MTTNAIHLAYRVTVTIAPDGVSAHIGLGNAVEIAPFIVVEVIRDQPDSGA